MLRFWPSGLADQTTPRASQAGGTVYERDPFDMAAAQAAPASPATSSATVQATSTLPPHDQLQARDAHAAAYAATNGKQQLLGQTEGRNHSRNGTAQPGQFQPNSVPTLTETAMSPSPSPGPQTSGQRTPAASGTRTPTIGTHNLHHHLLNAHITSYGGRGDATPTGPLSPGGSFSTPATTQLSLHPPEFAMKPPPLKRSITAQTTSSNAGNTFSSRGQIHVKLIQARGLRVPSPHSKPYVVVQFEQNEFVGRDPIPETEREAKGIATNLSRNNSSTALVTLERAAGNLSLQPRSRKDTNSSIGSQKSSNGLGATLFGTASPYNPVWKHEVSFDVTSDESYISFNVYDRSVDPEVFLGALDLKPVLIHEHTVDQWYKLRARDATEQVSGEIRIQLRYEQHKTKHHLSPRDFEFMKLIGRGTFGRVFQVRKKDTRRIYAMKVLSKKEIVAKKEVAHTIGERKILQRSLECPFLVGLKFSFQTETDLYLVTDFKSGGELFWHLQKETRFTEERARFYIAELVLALEHLHKYNIVYRDLKPENILLDATGHVALCDFGLSKPDLPGDQLTNTFCGTTEYLAPEVLLDDHGYSKLVDFWSLGVLLFEMCCGWSPFYAEDTQQMYKNICFGKIRFPRGVISEDGKQFVKGLLNRNPKHRLGALRDAAELKEHPFFHGIDWILLAQKKITPPFKPNVESDESTANFDPEFTSADLAEVGIDIYDTEDTSDDWTRQGTNGQKTFNGPQGTQAKQRPMNISGQKPQNLKQGSPLTSSVQDNFKGFTYTGDSVLQNASSFLEARDIHIEDDEALSDEEVERSEDELNEEVAAGRNARRRANDRMDVDP